MEYKKRSLRAFLKKFAKRWMIFHKAQKEKEMCALTSEILCCVLVINTMLLVYFYGHAWYITKKRGDN
jgi:hypothetical protein